MLPELGDADTPKKTRLDPERMIRGKLVPARFQTVATSAPGAGRVTTLWFTPFVQKREESFAVSE